MSIEKQVRRAFWRLMFFRLVGDVLSLPRFILTGLSHVIANISAWFGQFEKTVFAMEVDASRRYRALTGVDLGLAVGEPSRYSGARQGVAELRDARYDGTHLAGAEDE